MLFLVVVITVYGYVALSMPKFHALNISAKGPSEKKKKKNVGTSVFVFIRYVDSCAPHIDALHQRFVNCVFMHYTYSVVFL